MADRNKRRRCKRRRAARDDELEENVGLREVEGDEVLSSKFQEGGGASSGTQGGKSSIRRSAHGCNQRRRDDWTGEYDEMGEG
jgi:hypothetical protein